MTNPYPDLPPPPDAEMARWEDRGAHRYFEGRRWQLGRREVYVAGIQHPDGTVLREIVFHRRPADDAITAAQAREMARALIAAADEIERWAGKTAPAASSTPLRRMVWFRTIYEYCVSSASSRSSRGPGWPAGSVVPRRRGD